MMVDIREIYIQRNWSNCRESGRYENNGTFSLLKNAGELDIKTIRDIEDSNFNPVNKIYWRNTSLDFSNINNFLALKRVSCS